MTESHSRVRIHQLSAKFHELHANFLVCVVIHSVVKGADGVRIGAYKQKESRGSDSAQWGPPVIKGVMTYRHSDIRERRYSHPCHRMRSLIGPAGERPGGVFDCGMFGSS